LSKLLATLLILFGSVLPLMAETGLPSGTFKVANTEGFVEEDGLRTALAVDMSVGTVRIEISENDNLNLGINGTQISLFPLENGLAALQWNADGTSLLHPLDIQALHGKSEGKDVPAWGADVLWPDLGKVQLVLLPLGQNAYTGFLVSRPGARTIVRQMEFRKVFGPANRPAATSSTENSGS